MVYTAQGFSEIPEPTLRTKLRRVDAGVAAKTALSVDGVFTPEYDLDTTPVTPGDIGAYTSEETDAAIDAAVTPNWAPVIVAPATTTDYTTTTYTYVDDLEYNLVVGGTGEIFEVTATLDLAGYAANAATMVVVCEVDVEATGEETTYPVKIPVADLRMPMKFDWTLTGMAAGTHLVRIAAYLTATGNYQVGTGTTLKLRRIA